MEQRRTTTTIRDEDKAQEQIEHSGHLWHLCTATFPFPGNCLFSLQPQDCIKSLSWAD